MDMIYGRTSSKDIHNFFLNTVCFYILLTSTLVPAINYYLFGSCGIRYTVYGIRYTVYGIRCSMFVCPSH